MTVSTSTICYLCEDAVSSRQVTFCGVTLCPKCHEGGFGERLLEAGIRTQKTRWSFIDRQGKRNYFQATAAIPYPLDLTATFSSEGLFKKLGKSLFKKAELQIGDPDFDSEVFIETTTPKLLRALLQHDVPRQVIRQYLIELEHHHGPLVLDGNIVRVRGQKKLIEDEGALCRYAAVMARALQHYCVDVGTPSDDDLVVLPDLVPLNQGTDSANTKDIELEDTLIDSLDGLEEVGPVDYVSIEHSSIRSKDCSPLGKLGLRYLVLSCVSGVEELSWISSSEDLLVLSLNQTDVRDLRPLSKLQVLELLNLSNTPVEDLSPIARLKNLKKLYLCNTRISSLNAIAGLSNLQVLDVRETAVDDLGPVTRLKQLTELRVDDGKFSDTQLRELERRSGVLSIKTEP